MSVTRRGFFGRLAAGIVGLAIAPSVTTLFPEPVGFDLTTLIASTPTTGCIGGIDRATFTFWRNQGEAPRSAFDRAHDELREVYESCQWH